MGESFDEWRERQAKEREAERASWTHVGWLSDELEGPPSVNHWASAAVDPEEEPESVCRHCGAPIRLSSTYVDGTWVRAWMHFAVTFNAYEVFRACRHQTLAEPV